jgi:hypothetical protein
MSFPAKWDLADSLPDDVTEDALREMIANAHPYIEPVPPPAPVPLRLVTNTPTDTTFDSDPLATLTTLPNRTDVDDPAAFAEMLSGALKGFSAGLADRSGLERQALRPAAMEILKDRGVMAPTATVDAAIKDAVPAPHRCRAASNDDGFDPSSPYGIENGCIVLRKFDRDGNLHLKPLCNFTAEVTEEVDVDDGSGQSERRITITGQLADGRPLPSATVTATQFNIFNWVLEKWGVSAVVHAGMTIKDQLRDAVQMLSKNVRTRVVKAFTGWTRYLDGWRYLHRGGSIGADGAHTDLEVQLPRQLEGFVLPDPPAGDELVVAVHASLALAEVAPERLSLPLLAAAYRSVLGELTPVDLSIFLTGRSGVFKSCLAALVQAHWGAGFTAKTLPAGWHSTANSLEKLSFQAKDVLLTVDDFAPSGNRSDVGRMHQEAERLLRAAGNRLGRSRMNRSGGMAPEYHPRGLILSTGEDVPKGLSLRARMLVLEVEQGDVDLDKLTEAQANAVAGLYAAAMAGYVRYLAPRLDDLKTIAPGCLLELRTQASRGTVPHRRTPEIVASLQWGMETFLAFARDAGAVTDVEAEVLTKRTWAALGQAAAAQTAQLVDADPVDRFVAMLDTLLMSGRAHLIDETSGGTPRSNPVRWGWEQRERHGSFPGDYEYVPQGRGIGWVEAPDSGQTVLYFDPNAVYTEVQKLANDQGDSMSATQKTLWKRLAERGVIQPGSDGHSAIKKRGLGGDPTRRRVLMMPWPPKTGATGATGAEANQDQADRGPDPTTDPDDEGPGSGAGLPRPVPASSGGPAPRPLVASVGPTVADAAGPVTSTLPLDNSGSGPAGPDPRKYEEISETAAAAHHAAQQHKADCPGCATGRRCDEGRRLDNEYHARWKELQGARAACGDVQQAVRPDREPGADECVPAAARTSADLEVGVATASGGTTSTSPNQHNKTGQDGHPSERANV